MRKLMTSLAVLALIACNKPADTTADANAAAEANVAADANAMADANAATAAAFSLNGTSWEYTDKDGQAIQESIDPSGNYNSTSGAKHVDHGTMAMVDGKACFTSAMNKDGPVCWTVEDSPIGTSLETTSDKGEKLTVKRVAYVAFTPMK